MGLLTYAIPYTIPVLVMRFEPVTVSLQAQCPLSWLGCASFWFLNAFINIH